MHHLPNAGDWDIVKGLSLTENIQLLLCEWKSREKTQSVELVFQQLCWSLRVSFSFASLFWISGQDLGAGGEGERGSHCSLLRWEHLENFTVCICFVTVFAFSNNLTFRAVSSLESLPSRCSCSECQFPRGPFLPPSPAVGRTHIPGWPQRLAVHCSHLSAFLPTNAKSCLLQTHLASQAAGGWKFHSEWNIYLLPHTRFLVTSCFLCWNITLVLCFFWRWKIVTYCKKCLPHWRCR